MSLQYFEEENYFFELSKYTDKIKNLIGEKFGKLSVINITKLRDANGSVIWTCLCDCGHKVDVSGNSLKSGGSKSCGCSRLESITKHGHSNSNDGKSTATYNSWTSMMNRCYREQNHNFKYYGAKNVKVCDDWHDFINFLRDMGERPENTTLDRINPFGNYEKSNCRWATIEMQNNNMRKHKKELI